MQFFIFASWCNKIYSYLLKEVDLNRKKRVSQKICIVFVFCRTKIKLCQVLSLWDKYKRFSLEFPIYEQVQKDSSWTGLIGRMMSNTQYYKDHIETTKTFHVQVVLYNWSFNLLTNVKLLNIFLKFRVYIHTPGINHLPSSLDRIHCGKKGWISLELDLAMENNSNFFLSIWIQEMYNIYTSKIYHITYMS